MNGLHNSEQKHIVILATSDIHGNIWGYDYQKKRETEDGLARVCTYVQRVRSEEKNVLLIDAGDSLQGNTLVDELCDGAELHPVIEAMNYMSYDAMTLGNHDFDFGIRVQQNILRHADFSVLAGNLRNSSGEYFTGKGYEIFEFEGIRIALIGVITPFITMGNGHKAWKEELQCVAGTRAVAEIISQIEDRADVFMVSAHMDGYGEFDPENGSDSAWQIVRDNPKVALLQTAHSHVCERAEIGNTLCGEVRNGGKDVLRFDIWVNAEGEVEKKTVQIVEMKDYSPDKEILNLPVLKSLQEQAVKYKRSDEDASTVIARIQGEFQQGGKYCGQPITRESVTPLMQLITEVELKASKADIATCSIPNPNLDIAEAITEKNLDEIYGFPNYLTCVSVTGQELKNYMEWSARCFRVSEDGREIEYESDFPECMQDYFAGISYEIHASNPVGDRIKNIIFKGRPLDFEQKYILAVNNYRLNIYLRKEGILTGEKLWQSEKTIKELLREYLINNSPIAPRQGENCRVVLGKD